MATYAIDESQRKAAKAVGLTYLLTSALAYVSQFQIRSRLIVPYSISETVSRIVSSERLFRLSIATDILIYAADVVILVGLYVVLKSVSPGLALLAASWRLIETSVVVVATLRFFDVLRALSGAGYPQSFAAHQLQAFANFYLDADGSAYNIALLFFGLGSTVFACLWFKSRYIPRVLSAWGVFSSVLVVVCGFAFIVFPGLADRFQPDCYVPVGIFELSVGFWLVIRGLRPPTGARAGDALSPQTMSR